MSLKANSADVDRAAIAFGDVNDAGAVLVFFDVPPDRAGVGEGEMAAWAHVSPLPSWWIQITRAPVLAWMSSPKLRRRPRPSRPLCRRRGRPNGIDYDGADGQAGLFGELWRLATIRSVCSVVESLAAEFEQGDGRVC